jgi:hypothetical protein
MRPSVPFGALKVPGVRLNPFQGSSTRVSVALGEIPSAPENVRKRPNARRSHAIE